MSSFETMGIINLTPDSFSDGGEISSFDQLSDKIEKFRNFNVEIIDFGAESTAPFNNSVDDNKEQERLELLTNNLNNLDFTRTKISIDTYSDNTFQSVYEKLRGSGYKNEIIWNDVSSIVNSKKIEVLKGCDNTSYVLSHNLVDSNSNTNDHMNFVDPKLDVFSIIGKLKEGLIKLASIDQDRIIIDPCFGFAKTMEQNYLILQNIRKIVGAFDRDQRWLWGLSRKSMFHKLFDEDDYFSSEIMHSLSIFEIARIAKNSIFRVHEPKVTDAVKKYLERVYELKIG